MLIDDEQGTTEEERYAPRRWFYKTLLHRRLFGREFILEIRWRRR